MRGRVVDDVQRSCYYLTVPRVKSGLPVHGSSVRCATCAGDSAPGKCWLSFEEVRTRFELKTGNALAETSCENFRARSMGFTRGYAGEADETERLRI